MSRVSTETDPCEKRKHWLTDILCAARIQKNSHDHTFYGNRALCRLKLESWAGAEHDARIAIDLNGPKSPTVIKSSHSLAQALLHLQRPQEAHDVALAAYKLSIDTRNRNSEALSRIILRAKQAIWAAKETSRLREKDETLRGIEGLLESDLNKELERLKGEYERGEIGHVGYVEDHNILKEEAEKRLQDVREVFAAAKGGEMKERVRFCSPFAVSCYVWLTWVSALPNQVVPDYLIDSISFEIMHDPVVTPSGHSFDRVGILKHLQQSDVDPITRVPMTADDLRPNYALKNACEDFLNTNGWAVDW